VCVCRFLVSLRVPYWSSWNRTLKTLHRAAQHPPQLLTQPDNLSTRYQDIIHTHTPIFSCPVLLYVDAQTIHKYQYLSTCLTERLRLNVKTTAFVLVVYPLLCVSLSQAAALMIKTMRA